VVRTRPTWLDACFRAVLDVLAPPLCAACDASLARDSLFCDACEPDAAASALRELDGGPPLVGIGSYSGGLATAVQKLKYGGRTDLARPLGSRLASRILDAPVTETRGAVLVPVPLHRARLAARGYNQSALVASTLRDLLGLPLDVESLRRTKATREQALLAREDRRDNVAHAFASRPMQGARVVLVDDVVTTGATVLGCVRALADAGGTVVLVAALARAQPEH
jgi:ComF family protein